MYYINKNRLMISDDYEVYWGNFKIKVHFLFLLFFYSVLLCLKIINSKLYAVNFTLLMFY